MSTEVQTMANFDDRGSNSAAVAMRTPLYLIVAALGVLIVIASFLTWSSVGQATTVTGTDAGGWGAAAIIAGLAIAVLGVLGYFWNPFSDPEAMFIAGFGAVTAFAALIKILDPASLIVGASDFNDPDAAAGIGLWLILLAAVAAVLSGLWILYSRPKAEARIS